MNGPRLTQAPDIVSLRATAAAVHYGATTKWTPGALQAAQWFANPDNYAEWSSLVLELIETLDSALAKLEEVAMGGSSGSTLTTANPIIEALDQRL